VNRVAVANCSARAAVDVCASFALEGEVRLGWNRRDDHPQLMNVGAPFPAVIVQEDH
jgi:hypothetical protein